ncbi:heterocyst formation ABC transporter subunit HepA [Pannus brasiliensis CCIBt3594]|uniref:Heterocyst formation ABC transporter subunit HepA n=1 Tax=Pannus brasiliensis CCIBt3594 TaxID=1427578 RepID=A0AAW9R0K8_9CHRO
MIFSFARSIIKIVKNTRAWKDNYIIIREFKYFPNIAILALISTIAGALLEGAGIGLLVTFLQSLTDPKAEPFRIGILWFDRVFLGVDESPIVRVQRIGILILFITWTRCAINYLAHVCTEITQEKLLDRLRVRIFEQLQAFQLSFFSKSRSGELMNTLTTEIERLRQTFSAFSFLVTTSFSVLVYTVSLFLLSWKLTLIAFGLFSLLTVGLTTLNRKIREASFETTRASGQFTSIAIEFISGIRTVQAHAAQDFERRRFYRASAAIVRANRKSIRFWGLVKPLADALATTVIVGMLIFAFAFFVSRNLISIASLLTFFFVLFRFVPLLQIVNNVRAQLNGLVGSLDDVRRFLSPDDKPYFQNGARIFAGLTRSIELVEVDFGYDPERLILQDIDLTIERGRMTALVGASGAGKTTLVDLIARFHDPVRGRIFIDGIDLSSLEIGSLRRRMAIVSQDTFIFNTSVRDNIAYGLEGVPESDVIEAARLAHALEFIEELPEGFATVLGDRGVRLSGGQRQRIAIARALLRDPEILILDEATSALDSVSERAIQSSIEKLSLGRTVIAIAHRLSTIARADEVVVLEAGRIVERGSYEELLARQGKLWKYHQAQHTVAL